jgi:hypothetical protein
VIVFVVGIGYYSGNSCGGNGCRGSSRGIVQVSLVEVGSSNDSSRCWY